MVKVEKGKPRERTIITPGGEFQTMMEIPFEINGSRYTVKMPEEEFTPEKADELVRDKAKRIVEYQESELEV